MTVKYPGLLSEQQQSALDKQLTDTLTQWAKDWFTQGEDSIAVAPGEFAQGLFSTNSLNLDDYRVLGSYGDFICISEDKKSQLAALAMAVEGGNQADQQLFDRVGQTMLEQLCLSLKLDDNDKPVAPPKQFDFCLKVLAVVAGVKLNLLFNAAYLHRFAKSKVQQNKPAPGALSIKSVVAEQSIGFSLTMESQDLTVGQLMQLEVGHVIPLKNKIKEPLTLSSGEQPTKLKGYLVRKAQQKAVFITGIAK